MTIDTLATIIAVILGAGGISGGTWKLGAAVIRRALAVEGFRADVRDGLALLTDITTAHDRLLAEHEHRLTTLESPWTHSGRTELPPPVSTTPSR